MSLTPMVFISIFSGRSPSDGPVPHTMHLLIIRNLTFLLKNIIFAQKILVMEEIWKNIEGYEGLYQVSNLGRVKSLKFGKEKILKPVKNTFGYLQVILCKENIQKHLYVHRLVAQAFIPNPLNLPEINHKTEDKQLNYVWCLEYCDRKYNNNYGTHNERSANSRINHPAKSRKVICVETNIIYPSSMEAQRQTGISQSNIISCCKGKYKSAGGYHWKYYN